MIRCVTDDDDDDDKYIIMHYNTTGLFEDNRKVCV